MNDDVAILAMILSLRKYHFERGGTVRLDQNGVTYKTQWQRPRHEGWTD